MHGDKDKEEQLTDAVVVVTVGMSTNFRPASCFVSISVLPHHEVIADVRPAYSTQWTQ